MKIFQQHIQLSQRRRGFHLITAEVIHALPQIGEIKTGICHVFIQHTSASLTINENADPTVRKDFEMYFSKTVPENDPEYLHDDEGPDDMPAHICTMLTGVTLSVPVADGRMLLGTWQGLFLAEPRRVSHTREVIAHLIGN